MTKKELLKILNKIKGNIKKDNSDLEKNLYGKIEKVENILYVLEDDYKIDNIESVDIIATIKDSDFTISALNQDFMQETLALLDKMYIQLRCWLKQPSLLRESETKHIETMNNHTRKILRIALVIIIILAIAAFVCMILKWIYKNCELLDDLAETFGLLDFCVGAIAFVSERREDMKKKEFKKKMSNVIETENLDEFVKLTKEINKTYGNNSPIQKGLININRGV